MWRDRDITGSKEERGEKERMGEEKERGGVRGK